MNYEELFSKYNEILQNDLKGNTVMNYVSSHDDSSPYDKKREKTFESGTKLLLAPGILASPYVFSRTFSRDNFTDKVIIGLDLPKGQKEISVGTIFKDGTKLKDAYSGKEVVVSNGKVTIDTEFDIVLLEK